MEDGVKIQSVAVNAYGAALQELVVIYHRVTCHNLVRNSGFEAQIIADLRPTLRHDTDAGGRELNN